MFKTYFSAEQLLPLYPSLLLILISILVFHYSGRTRPAVILLLLGALGMRIWAALLDPFLNPWDEQFHALIAKHMMAHPFMPMLYTDPVLPYNIADWDHNHVWLHKQPLYLWQIALSFKLFGLNEFALRLPSVLLSAAATFCIYRMGKLSVNVRIGFYAALLWALSSFGLNIVSGRQVCDHNDVAFVSYVIASLWAWTEYNHSGKKHWIAWIGLFAGAAVLVKWLTGMMVFGAWGITILFDAQKRKQLSSYLHIVYSMLIAVIVFLPWQLYILHSFPGEARYNYALNTAHFTHVVPPHGGDSLFYYHNLATLYGEWKLMPVLVIIAFILLIPRLKKDYRIAFVFLVAAVYTFFTIAATKMDAFCFPVSAIIFIALGSLIDSGILLLNKMIKGKVFYFSSAALVMIIALLNLDIERLQSMHTSWRENEASFRYFSIVNKSMYKRLPQQLPAGDFVIFGCRSEDHVKIMFYTDYTAYDTSPGDSVLASLKAKGIKMAAYDYAWLPENLKKDPDVIKIVPLLP